MRPRNAQRSGGFTLVELLVVIGIIALLMSILIPALSKARQQAQNVNCQSNLRSIGQFMVMYSQTNRDVMFPPKAGGGKPPYERWPAIVFPPSHIKISPMPKIMVCPSDSEVDDSDIQNAQQHSVDVSWVKHSYVVNMHMWYDDVRYNRTHKVQSSRIIVAGEKQTKFFDFRMNCDGPGQSQYPNIVEELRHGKAMKSNLLFLDGHVDKDEPPAWTGPKGEKPEDRWDIRPGGDYSSYR